MLQCLKEALHHGILVGVAGSRHANFKAVALELCHIVTRGILYSLVRVMDNTGTRPPPGDCHFKRLQCQGGIQPGGDGIAHHLVEAESHHQREEDVLFPELEKHGITEPTLIMKMDHTEFRKRKQALYQLVRSGRKNDFADFKKEVIELGEYLPPELESHIFKEDNLIYQIALQMLEPKEWEKVKKLCDELGYCCFTRSMNLPEKRFRRRLRPLNPPLGNPIRLSGQD